eukprot:COSAG06_NODE_8769_length_2074_cov_5.273785_3_plen_75_part_00
MLHAACSCIPAYAVAMDKYGKDFRLEWVDAGHSSDDKQVTQEQQQMRMEFALATLAALREQAEAPATATVAARL